MLNARLQYWLGYSLADITKPVWLYSLGLTALLPLLAALVIGAPYLHDFSEWMFQGKVIAQKLNDPDSVMAYQLAPYPVPNSLVVSILAAANLLVSPVLAGKIFQIGVLILWCFASHRFCRRWLPWEYQSGVWVTIVCLAGFSSFFFYGYSAYHLGCAIFLLFLTRYGEKTTYWEVSLFGVSLFFAHAMPFLAWGLLVAILVICSRFPWTHMLAMIPAGALSMAFLIGRHYQEFAAPVSNASWKDVTEMIVYKAGTITMLGPFKNFLLPDGSSLLENQPVLYWLGVSTNVTAISLLGCSLLFVFVKNWTTLRESGPSRTLDMRMSLLAYAMLLAGFCILAPHNFFGMENPGLRVVIPMLLAALPSFALLSPVAVRWFALFVAIVSISTTMSYSANIYVALADGIEHQVNSRPPAEARKSVLAYNDWLYRNTRYKYYNYRIYAMAHRMESAETGRLTGLVFLTGPIVKYAQPASAEN